MSVERCLSVDKKDKKLQTTEDVVIIPKPPPFNDLIMKQDKQNNNLQSQPIPSVQSTAVQTTATVHVPRQQTSGKLNG